MQRHAFLVLEGHPYGRRMLQRLREAGLAPALVIAERSTVAEKERAKFEARMAGLPAPPSMQELSGDLELVTVGDHNEPRCLELLRQAGVDWVLLGGTRILKGALLELDMLNVHPGLLPWVRGSSAEAWSIMKDHPVGVTCHRVDSGVDTGPILLRRLLELAPAESYEHIVWRNMGLAAQTMVEALQLLQSGEARFLPQQLEEGHSYRVMGPARLEEVRRRLASEAYSPRAVSL